MHLKLKTKFQFQYNDPRAESKLEVVFTGTLVFEKEVNQAQLKENEVLIKKVEKLK